MKTHHTELTTGTCNTTPGSNGLARNTQPLKFLNVGNDGRLPLKYAFLKECICPICFEKETLHFFIGRMALAASKNSPKEFVLQTVPGLFSYWGSRSTASPEEARAIQGALDEFVKSQELVTAVGPCAKHNNHWAFFTDPKPDTSNAHRSQPMENTPKEEPEIRIVGPLERIPEIEPTAEGPSMF